jgi:hypothetical protein
MEIPIYRKKIDNNTGLPILDELGNEIMEFICYEVCNLPLEIINEENDLENN